MTTREKTRAENNVKEKEAPLTASCKVAPSSSPVGAGLFRESV